MELRQLRHFLRAIDSASISRAAQSLNIAQPSLSQSLKELESAFGVQLLHRSPRGVRPTETGAMVAERARAILRLADNLQREARMTDQNPAGDLFVGLPTTIALHMTLPLVRAVREQMPKVNLRLSEGMSGHIREWLLMGRLDLAILYNADPVEGLEIEELVREDLCLISRASPAAAATPVRLAELSGFSLVLPGPEHGLRQSIDRALGGRQSLDIAVQVDSLPHLKRLSMDGALHTILPRAACREEIASGQLLARPIIDPPLRRPIVLAVPNERPLSPAGRQVIAMIRTLVAGAIS